jgi:hypothetical protein
MGAEILANHCLVVRQEAWDLKKPALAHHIAYRQAIQTQPDIEENGLATRPDLKAALKRFNESMDKFVDEAVRELKGTG